MRTSSDLGPYVATFPWRPHFIEHERIWASAGSVVQVMKAEDLQVQSQMSLRSLAMPAGIELPRSAAELLRHQVHHLMPLSQSSAVVFFKRTVAIVDLEKGTTTHSKALHGSRPLYPCDIPGAIAYGDYVTRNSNRPITIQILRKGTAHWEPVHSFSGIRHVHGIFTDRWADCLWISTGDTDEESAIWRADHNLRKINPVRRGSQYSRTVFIAPTRNGLIFGTDSPTIQNQILLMNRSSGETTVEAMAPSSVFSGCMVRDWIFLSCAGEPSTVNPSDRATLLARTPSGKWFSLVEFPVSRLCSRYTLFGQLNFPLGSGDDRYVWVSSYALKVKAATHRWPVPDTESEIHAIWPGARRLDPIQAEK